MKTLLLRYKEFLRDRNLSRILWLMFGALSIFGLLLTAKKNFQLLVFFVVISGVHWFVSGVFFSPRNFDKFPRGLLFWSVVILQTLTYVLWMVVATLLKAATLGIYVPFYIAVTLATLSMLIGESFYFWGHWFFSRHVAKRIIRMHLKRVKKLAPDRNWIKHLNDDRVFLWCYQGGWSVVSIVSPGDECVMDVLFSFDEHLFPAGTVVKRPGVLIRRLPRRVLFWAKMVKDKDLYASP